MNPATEARKALCGKILAIDEARLDSMLAALSLESSADIEARKPLAQPRSRSGRVAVVPIYGFIEQRGSLFQRMFGGTSTEEVSEVLDQLVADTSVDQIIFDFDTPGGTVPGVQSLADKMFQVRSRKNTFGIANSLAASAGYWLAAQVSELWAAPGAEVGSIGVFAVHQDMSEAAERAGVKHSVIKAGRLKAMGNPYEKLSDEVRGIFQAKVDAHYKDFVSAVAKGRNTRESAVRNGFGEGATLLPPEAMSEGMIDKVGTLQDLLASLGVKTSAAMARAEEGRRELAHYKARARLAGLST